ncbi:MULTISPECIES: GNAT family N-acetyltransferase [Cytobacillus]|uniref:GNAT family N-acetyltransferase n=1 Tax=Cytobacillus TaxID=2675230 RepID=UPI002040F1DB|nr:GNAT family N-acetyltransferase [Cytobacillus firmus]MCM3706603.1 GNAT family N-acetyltransferase [Cytobacillus firmus]
MKQEALASLVIKNLHTVKDLEAVYELEAGIWSVEEAVPVNHTVATVKNGGFVLGAFVGEKLIGFQYSFPGYDGTKAYLCSHSLGIHQEYRALGIGEKLKYAQKQTALEKGYDLISWTYDPLETVNANLNLHKLRAVCTQYTENAYGEMSDQMNAGIPSDRFLVEWRILDESPVRQLSAEVLPRAIEIEVADGLSTPEGVNLEYENEKILIPVPGNFQDIKKREFELALKWRKSTKEAFAHYLSKGWIVTDLIKDETAENQYLYLLEKR